MKVEVVLEDMGARKNGAKMPDVREYFLTCPRAKL
jgi:hypothetical protein